MSETQTQRMLGRALDLAAGRVRDAEALIDATGKLRLTLDRYDWFISGWTVRHTGFNPSTLKLKVSSEFIDVSSAAAKLGGKDVLAAAEELDDRRGLVLGIIDPSNPGGISYPEANDLMVAVDAVRLAATVATGRKRRLQWFLVTAFILGLALGFLIGAAVQAIS